MQLGWFAHPILHGDYPPVMKEFIHRRSKEEGREKSRLPEFEQEWIQKILGTTDFLGINNYTSRLIEHVRSKVGEVGHVFDHDAKHHTDPSWKRSSGTSWLYSYP